MAEKKQTQSKVPATTNQNSSRGKKQHANEKATKYEQLEMKETKERRKIPPRIISASVMGILFVLLLVTWMEPNGWFIRFFYNIVRGLFGQAAFYMAIPGFLLMFYIHAFSGKKPILMRSVCLGVFMLCFGCIAHWWGIYYFQNDYVLGSGFQWVKDIYRGGVSGMTGGLICGGLTELMLWIFNEVLTLIVLVFTGVLTLMATFNITIPSIARAIQNRPRAQWEEEKPAQEPAAVVINHIANKRIDHLEKKRRKKEEALMELEVVELPPVPEAVILSPSKPPRKTMDRAEELQRQIDQEPVAPQKNRSIPQVDDSIFTPPSVYPPKKDLTENLPENMPELDMDELPEIQKPMPAAEAEVKQKVTAKEAAESAAMVAEEIAQNEAVEKPEYRFPPIDLLKASSGSAVDGTAEMRENTRRLNETLASFKIEARIINVTRGPSVTRYEVELDKGVRLNKLTTIADDIALSIGASGVRIAAVPGKISVVGIEVPNRAVSPVSLREVIDSNEFRNAKSKTTFSVGKDIGGNCITGNIAKLPHMLIAGTTGSGKSVCMNSIIISLLYKASPDDVKLIMIDPKMVELGIYNAIPHLLIPVVTDPKKAAGSLQWAVTEMMRRYKAMSDAGVRDLESFNAIVESDGQGAKLPQVVVIIDELADLMMVAGKQVEDYICRIAQKARAAGMHLIVATQRPSVDVITGLIKANIPSRVAFAVSSQIDSRTILDGAGAEKLLGMGDMLFLPVGAAKPVRIQGTYVKDSEIERVIDEIKSYADARYDEDMIAETDRRAVAAENGGKEVSGGSDTEEDGQDPMLRAAIETVVDAGMASTSLLQRKLKLGYARAARIMDEMESLHVIGPYEGSKPRQVLITRDQFLEMSTNGRVE